LRPRKINPVPFGERPGAEPYNASEIVALADSKFLFCDNNISDALFELLLTPEGQMACPLVRRPIEGVEAGAVDDMEGMALVEYGGRRFIFVTPSLSLKQRKKPRKKKIKRGKAAPARSSLLRIEVGPGGRLEAEVIPDLRSWLIENAPELGKSISYLPDDGGLNIEALGWHPDERSLLLGLRTPLLDGRPIVLRVGLKEIDGPWALSNLQMLAPVRLAIEEARDEQGIRSIEYDPSRGVLLVVVGNSTSSSKAPFRLYTWDGNMKGEVHRFRDIRFDKKMRVEGVTHGIIGGRGGIVFVDDAGGYQVVWDDDPRLQKQI
jgi:hypothetical protein